MSRGRIINNILLDYLIIYIYRREKQKVYLKTFAFYIKGLYLCLGIERHPGWRSCPGNSRRYREESTLHASNTHRLLEKSPGAPGS